MSLEEIREQFPQLTRSVNGAPLCYLDSAATTVKPLRVIERLQKFYGQEVSNVHRGAHYIGDEATAHYEQARAKLAKFLGAKDSEIIFTRGTTESVNLVASSLANGDFQEGDEILVSEMEHHSNIVPWHLAVQKTGAVVRAIPITDEGDIDIDAFKSLLSEKTKLVAITHMSNVLGTIVPVKEITRLAHAVGAKVLIDGAQSVSALKVDVADIGCDYFAFSGHKLFAPFGVGVLFAKEDLLNQMPPYQGGGSMISQVSMVGSEYLDAPQRFEAGTPNVGGAVALAEAIDFVEDIGFSWLENHETRLYDYALKGLAEVGGVNVYGRSTHRRNVISMEVVGAHHSDVTSILDQQAVAVRAGHLCAQPLMKRLGVSGVLRASFSIYTSEDDVDRFCSGLRKAKEMLL